MAKLYRDESNLCLATTFRCLNGYFCTLDIRGPQFEDLDFTLDSERPEDDVLLMGNLGDDLKYLNKLTESLFGIMLRTCPG